MSHLVFISQHAPASIPQNTLTTPLYRAGQCCLCKDKIKLKNVSQKDIKLL